MVAVTIQKDLITVTVRKGGPVKTVIKMSMNVKMKHFVKTMELALTLKDHMYAVVWKDGKAITVKQIQMNVISIRAKIMEHV